MPSGDSHDGSDTRQRRAGSWTLLEHQMMDARFLARSSTPRPSLSFAETIKAARKLAKEEGG